MTDTTNPKDIIGAKKAPLRLVPPALVIQTAPAMALGATKYGPYNWRDKAVRMSIYLEAAQRHILAFQDGEDLDPESGHSHLGHASACLAILFDAGAIGKLVDDRPPPGAAAQLLAQQAPAPAADSPEFFEDMVPYGDQMARVVRDCD